MTLPRSETPLRRSAVGSYREGMTSNTTVVNDDEAERQEARRRTLMQPRKSTLESIEDNEAIRSCLEIYNGNKLSKDNAWSVSLIDSLANLLDHHHKRMSNFKMAGSSLEASSKVYGLRVDSIYLDAMRISAGLSARTLTDKQINAAENDDGTEPSQAGGEGDDSSAAASQKGAAPKPKRQKKNVSTVTKNKETLNARLDTTPLQDPVFGQLNSTVGSINASNRLMHNILPSRDSELLLRTNYKFWDSEEVSEDIEDYTTLSADKEQRSAESLVSADWLRKLLPQVDKWNLRPMHTGYIITSAPNPKPSDEKPKEPEPEAAPEEEDDGIDNADDMCANINEISMAFDVEADVAPLPDLDAAPPQVLEVGGDDLQELTIEEQMVIHNCRRLRKQATVIDDLRPVDGSSKLEYSYRPMEQISQFWAGPSHWKFKRNRARSTLFQANGQTDTQVGSTQKKSSKKSAQQAAKRKNKMIAYDNVTQDFFQPLDASVKQRKVNFQKKWDSRKLSLPTKFIFDSDYFFKYDSAPSIKLTRRAGEPDSDDADDLGLDMDVGSDHGDVENDLDLLGNEHFTAAVPANVSIMLPEGAEGVDGLDLDAREATIGLTNVSMRDPCNNTVLEIGTEFEGAPSQVTKVIVPFAKRAKVIDMKNLKKSCNSLIQKQMLNVVPEETIPSHPRPKKEQYSKGVASFQNVYCKLPTLLTTKMSDSLSTSVAFYAVLHLANDMKLRLIPQPDLEDFQIRQVLD
ncbi:condensin complex subunit 2 [Drosophila bipectinata]|uniref:condensin complex subunit 2 n=1 Tax=Drosophila bipectinata TaxID=42026 RepID=UPI001C8ADCCB|nr:condensin complex subunit 2 [Drosophila bipectinata]